tara:strand:- start:1804 stop:2121 length:318 start_codon:yes stop_codon:yes gene_type:complete
VHRQKYVYVLFSSPTSGTYNIFFFCTDQVLKLIDYERTLGFLGGALAGCDRTLAASFAILVSHFDLRVIGAITLMVSNYTIRRFQSKTGSGYFLIFSAGSKYERL